MVVASVGRMSETGKDSTVYPFAERVYTGAIELGLWQAFAGDVLIYVHKERELDDVERRYPAERYVLVDDKLRILAAVKQAWGDRVTTIFPRRGHYALEAGVEARFPPADLTVDRVGDLIEILTELGRSAAT